MPKIVLKDVSVVVNAVDISNKVSQVTITTSRPPVDVTSMGDVNTEELPGIGTAEIAIDVFNDYGSGSLDSQMFALSQSNTPVVIVCKPTSAAVGTSNPTYTMTGLLYDYSPIAGGVGAPATTQLTFRNAAQTGLVRATS